jgi:rhodanese-related sulfurtransferase
VIPAIHTPSPLEISCAQTSAQRDQLTLVDCRETPEHEICQIPGADLLPMSQIEGRMQELAPLRGRPLVVICHHGVRSLQVAIWLRQQGFAQAQSMAGGIDRWAIEVDPAMTRY